MTDAISPRLADTVNVSKSVNDCVDNPRSPESITDELNENIKHKNHQNIPNGCVKQRICDEESTVNKLSTVSLNSHEPKDSSSCNSTPLSALESSNHVATEVSLDSSSLSSVSSVQKSEEEDCQTNNCSHESCLCSGDCFKTSAPHDEEPEIEYVVYESELQMPHIMNLITKDLSEPYSIYTYRYFIHNWPKLCFLAKCKNKYVGAIVCKLDVHKKMSRRGYIAMLAVDKDYRRRGMGSELVLRAIRAMVADDCDEVVLETEISNKAALRLYENLGFVRDKRLFRYYLNGVDALRLKLWLR